MDAVIILANLMDIEGNLNVESLARLKRGVEVYKDTNAEYIITTGWAYRADSSICIADAFKKHILNNYDIPADKVIADTNARDTVGDAFFTKINVVARFGFEHVGVVTSDYHVQRTEKIFRFIFGEACRLTFFGASVFSNSDIIENEKKSMIAFERTFENVRQGDNNEIVNALRIKHPFYNGEIYPSI